MYSTWQKVKMWTEHNRKGGKKGKNVFLMREWEYVGWEGGGGIHSYFLLQHFFKNNCWLASARILGIRATVFVQVTIQPFTSIVKLSAQTCWLRNSFLFFLQAIHFLLRNNGKRTTISSSGCRICISFGVPTLQSCVVLKKKKKISCTFFF